MKRGGGVKVKERYRLRGARRSICRHSAHNVPSMPVGHVMTAPSITLHTGKGERYRQTDRQRVRERERERGVDKNRNSKI